MVISEVSLVALGVIHALRLVGFVDLDKLAGVNDGLEDSCCNTGEDRAAEAGGLLILEGRYYIY